MVVEPLVLRPLPAPKAGIPVHCTGAHIWPDLGKIGNMATGVMVGITYWLIYLRKR